MVILYTLYIHADIYGHITRVRIRPGLRSNLRGTCGQACLIAYECISAVSKHVSYTLQTHNEGRAYIYIYIYIYAQYAYVSHMSLYINICIFENTVQYTMGMYRYIWMIIGVLQ